MKKLNKIIIDLDLIILIGFSIFVVVSASIYMSSFNRILENQKVIENNWRCIDIVNTIGVGSDYCKCINDSINLNHEKELEQEYIDIYNKFCNNRIR